MRPFALLAVCLFAASAAVAQGTSAAGFVRPDGTLDLAGASAGTVDLAGMKVTMGADGSLRTSAEGEYTDISSGPSGVPLNGPVNALAVGPDGTVYAAGAFNRAGGSLANRVARRTATGWEPLGSGVDGVVYALAVAGDGSVYVGGIISTAGGVVASHVARWTGATWQPFGSGINNLSTSGGAARVDALAVPPDGSVYVGGEFTTAGGAPASRVARWTGAAWQPLGSGVNGGVYALAVAPDGSVYAGGDFTTAGGVVASQVARWTGTAWEPLGSGMGGTGISGVRALSVAPDGSVYAGGLFTTAGGVAAGNVARWNGTAWEPLGSGVNNTVYALAVAPDGSVYAGGMFTTAGGTAASRVARWTGTAWQPLGSGMTGGIPDVYALAVAADGAVYAGGNFTTAGGATVNKVARWSGTAWQPLGSGIVDGGVRSLSGAFDGSVYVGGSFSTAGGTAANNVARWTGTEWEALGSGVGSGVFALAVAVDGSVYVGGIFTTAGGTAASNVARWTGTAWEALGSGVGGTVSSTTTVSAVAVDRRGDVVIGGAFTVAGGVPSPYITLYDAPVVVASQGSTPGGSRLALAVSPNPISAGGTVRVTLAEAGPVRVALYDVLGRQVAVLTDGVQAAGEHAVGLGAERLVPGVYVVRVTAGAASAVQRVTVAR